MIAVETRWFARVGNGMCLFISFVLREPSISDRSSINIVMPMGKQQYCVLTCSTLRAPYPCSTASQY